MEVDTMGNKKVARGERKRKKLLAEYELARSNDAVKRPGQLLDSKEEGDEETGKRARVDTQRLSDADFKKLKKQLADRKKILLSLPRFLLQYAGNSAALTVPHDERSPILMSDLQQLLSYALYGNSFITPPQRWCLLQKPNRLTNMVTLVVEGITIVDYFDYEDLFPNLTKHFEEKVELLAPACYGSNVIRELVRVCPSMGSKEAIIEKARSFESLTDTQDRLKAFRALFSFNSQDNCMINSNSSIPSTLPSNDTFPRTYLLLSMCQMLMEGFPLPMHADFGCWGEDTSNFIPSKLQYTQVHENSQMFAIDCEMCFTEANKLELTRIAIVNEKLEVVYETLVKPSNKILNYLTQYSGITKQLLADVETTLEDVQSSIQNILPSDAILIGHSLNCDLKAIRIYHPYVIDTSVIFNLTGTRHRKPKLVTLAERFLKEEIQQSSKGHSPIEDATAAMKLVLLKLSKGYLFGDSMENQQGTEDGLAVSVFQNSAKAKKTVAVIGPEETLKCYNSICEHEDSEHYKQILTTSDRETIDHLLQSAVLHNFSLAHIDVSKKLSKCKSPQKRKKVFKKLDKWIESLFNHISLNGMCTIVFGGPKDDISTGANLCDNSVVTKAKTLPDPINGNIKSNGSVDINNPKEDTTDSNSDNNNGSSIESSESKNPAAIQSQLEVEESQNQQQCQRRQNGVVFIRIKTSK